MTDLHSVLDWQAVLLVKVHKQALSPHQLGLSVSRMHLAGSPDGIIASGWDVPVEKCQYLHEGIRHADKPGFFDFHQVDLPDPDAADSK